MIRLQHLLVALAICAVHVHAQNADVSAERVSMDAALLRVLQGHASPGTMAVWPQSQRRVTSADSSSTNPLLRKFHDYLNEYYGTSVSDSVKRFRLYTENNSSLNFGVDASMMFRAGSTTIGDTADPFLLARPAMRFMGNLDGTLGFFLDLSNGVKLRGDSRRIATSDPVLGRTFKFLVEEQQFFDRYIGYVQYQGEHLRVRFGREQIQMGFSPIDNLVHSINAAPMDGLLIDVPYKSVRFTSTHSMVDGADTAGVAVPGKFVATHRLAIDPLPWLSVAVSDVIVYWNRGLDLAYLNPLAFFVSAGLGTADRSATDNSMLGVDVAVRPMDGMLVYGSFIADDLAFSTIGDTSWLGNNNKYAWQLGLSQLVDVAAMPLLLSAEYVRIDPFTFSHRSMSASYTHMGAPIGYDMQSNSDRVAAQVRLWLAPRTFVRLDVDYTRWGENILDVFGNVLTGEDPRFPGSGAVVAIGNVGGNISRGDGDFLQGNRFLRGVVSHSRRVNLWFSSELLTNVFADVRVGYRNRSGGNDPGSVMFGSVELRVGY